MSANEISGAAAAPPAVFEREGVALRRHTLPGGLSFLRADYRLRPLSLHEDHLVPPEGWQFPSSAPVSDAQLPFDWPANYYSTFKQAFEPSVFYRNLTAILNHIRAGSAEPQQAGPTVDFLIEKIYGHSILVGGARFINYSFLFDREGYDLSPGWVSAIGNGFALRGVVSIIEELGHKHLAGLADELAAAYLVTNTGGRPRPWFTFVDENEFLWFDEYPADDGYPTLVLNGHIHAIFGLLRYCRWRKSAVHQALLQGGLATMRFNARRFRQPLSVNRYSLREPTRPDYNPGRTVRQQRELGRLTGDPWFLSTADLFEADVTAFEQIRASGRELRESRKKLRAAEEQIRLMKQMAARRTARGLYRRARSAVLKRLPSSWKGR